jgi:hypothetical protein
VIVKHHPGCHYHKDWAVEGDGPFSEIGLDYWELYAVDTATKFFRKNFPDIYKGGFRHDDPDCTRKCRLRDIIFEMNQESCGCPRYTVYDNLNVLEEWHFQQSDGSQESGVELRCPICGIEFTIT